MDIEIAVTTWVAISPAVIEDCFKHAGSAITQQASCRKSTALIEGLPEGTNDDSSVVPLTLINAWGILCALDKIPGGFSANEFIHVDEDVVAHEELTDKAIISSVYNVED